MCGIKTVKSVRSIFNLLISAYIIFQMSVSQLSFVDFALLIN